MRIGVNNIPVIRTITKSNYYRYIHAHLKMIKDRVAEVSCHTIILPH